MMKHAGLWALWLVVQLGVSGVPAAVAGPDAAGDRTQMGNPQEQVAKRLQSVSTLIERSSAAKQIDASGNPEAAALRNQARELHRQAEEAYKAGDYSRAQGRLEEASRKMFEGARLANPGQVTGQKKRDDYAARKESVGALMDALKRIGAEKGQQAKVAEANRKIEGLVKDADAAVQAGNVDRGRIVLDQAYATAKLTVDSLRGGDTLVRSLNFASKEEEFRYELDRNETHQMLIKAFILDKQSGVTPDERMRSAMQKAEDLRRQADDRAAKKDYEAAVKLLEDATRELQRAIRGAGLYIPG